MVIRARGFTLIELVFAVLLAALLSFMTVRYVGLTAEGFAKSRRLSTLVTQARLALDRISADVEYAVPGSPRVSASGNCLEFLPVKAVTRYLDSEANGISTALIFPVDKVVVAVNQKGLAKTQQSNIATGESDLRRFSVIAPEGSNVLREVEAGESRAVDVLGAIYAIVPDPSQGFPDASLYGPPDADPGPVHTLDRVGAAPMVDQRNLLGVSPSPTSQVIRDVRLIAGVDHSFPEHSSDHYAFFASKPVSYCIDADGRLRRYDSYGLIDDQPDPPAGSGIGISESIVGHSFESFRASGSEQQHGVKIRLDFADRGQSYTVEQEVQVLYGP